MGLQDKECLWLAVPPGRGLGTSLQVNRVCRGPSGQQHGLRVAVWRSVEGEGCWHPSSGSRLRCPAAESG